jgi:hypothetical protein
MNITIKSIFIQGMTLVLQDTDGSEITMSLRDALKLEDWLSHHPDELAAPVIAQDWPTMPTHAKIKGLVTEETGDLLTHMTGMVSLEEIARGTGTTVPAQMISLIGMAEQGLIELQFFSKK